MRRIFGLVIIFFFAASIRPVLASAPVRYYDWSVTTQTSPRVLGEATPSASVQNFIQFDRYLIGGNLTPDNPFYFIKGLQEGMQFALAFDPKTKEKLRLELAGERLGEMQIMAEKGNTGAVKNAAKSYQQTMEGATQNLKNSTPETETEMAKHQVVLGEVAAKVPNAAEDAVRKAMQASEKSSDMLADLSGRPAIPPDVVDRITALKAQGLLTAEEANKLISFKTRVEARQELRKYTDSGILPAADLLRMNEQMKTSFPQDFYKIHEMERFEEMKKLEGQKLDSNTQKKVQEFAKTYKPGEMVPADIRPYWAPLVRLEEMQNTFRPDLIDPNLFKNNPDDAKKFQEIVERYKPRQEDVDFVKKYMDKNKTAADQLPPEYQRMYNLSQAYGVQTTQPPVTNESGQKVSCPTNAHYTNGYCIPNYTPRGESAYCPGGYHRNYQDGPCLPDNYSGGYLPPLTTTPGNYPSPYYPPTTQCGSNSHWVPEPINPRGGYCAPDNYQPPTITNSYPPNPSMGNCTTPQSCYDWCKANPGKCGGFDQNSPRPSENNASGTPSREAQEAACKAGGGTCVSWVNGACGCERPGGTVRCQAPSSGCGSNKWWDQNSCACRENGSYPSACTYPQDGCGSGNYWDSGSCSCRQSNSATPAPTYSNRSSQEATCQSGGGTCNWSGDTCQCQGYRSPSNYVPPSGYGSCSSGQYWNGSTCVANSPTPSSTSAPSGMSRESQESGCRSCGGTCSWNGDNCNCRCGNTTPTPSPAPEPTPAPTPSPTPVPSSPPPSNPEPSPEAQSSPTP